MVHPIHETADLIPAAKVTGTPVFNVAGEKMGTIEEIMLNKRSGTVAYAVMSFGGFLGLGRRYHPVPWSVLGYSEEQGGYVIDRDRSSLEAAPTLEDASDGKLADPAFRDDLERHYRS